MSWNGFKMKTSIADKLFSWFIRWRDKWTCQVCFWPANQERPEDRANLDCAHYFGRGNQSTRFDPDNAFAACKKCHTNYLHGPSKDPEKQRHTELMAARLGPEKWALLWLRGHSNGKKPDEFMMRALWSAELRKMGVDPNTGKRFPRALSSFDPDGALLFLMAS